MNLLVSSGPSIRIIEEHLLPSINHLKSILSGSEEQQQEIVSSVCSHLEDFFSQFSGEEDWTGCPLVERYVVLRKTLLEACIDLTTQLHDLRGYRHLAIQLLIVPSEIIGCFSSHRPRGLPRSDLLDDIPLMDCVGFTFRNVLLACSGMSRV